MKKIDFLVIFFIIAASFFTLKDLFLPGFYTSHDGPHQVVRAYYFNRLITEGQIPPRWVGGLNYGFGYPLFIFSYHMPWLIAEPFLLMGFDVFWAIKLTFICGFILSGIFMYFYQKSLFGRLPAFIGSLIYLYAPFRFSNIFVRAAIGDATAFIFAPLLFWSVDASFRKASLVKSAAVGLSLTALLLSHAMVSFFYFSAFILYVFFLWLFNKNRLKQALYIFLSLVLFVGYSCYYLLPSLIERSFTKFNSTLGAISSSLNFVPFQKLIYSPWGYGTVDAPAGAMSLAIGIAQLLVALSALILIIFRLLKKNSPLKFSTNRGVIFFILFVVTIILMTPVSKPIWLRISKYLVIDYNWRILNLTVFSASLVAGWLVFSLHKNRLFQAGAGFIILALAFYSNRNHIRINQSLDWSIPFFLKLEKTTNSFDEYMPKWADNTKIVENAPRFIPNPEVIISEVTQKNNLIRFNADVKETSNLILNSLYYPGWTVYDNNLKKPINFDNAGLIAFPVEKGSHHIRIVFEKTPLRKYSDLVTILSISLTAVYLLRRYA